jgi:2-iminobutanoate/2-iminopropanoate deaminase
MRQKSLEVEGLGHAAPIPMACRVGPILATSAVGGADPKTGKLSEELDAQIAQAFHNLGLVLAEGGMDYGDVVKITVWVGREEDRGAVNKYWNKTYPDEHHRPARHAVVSALRGGMKIQLEALAVAKDA